MDASKPRRRWLRFSVRGLLIFVTVASALLAWRVKAVRDVDRAVANLRRAGLSVIPGWFGKPDPRSYWTRIISGEGSRVWDVHMISNWNGPTSWLEKSNVDDKVMSGLIDDLKLLGQINLLDLHDSAIGNSTLEAISTLHNVRWLDVQDTHIDDGGLTYLEGMTELECLDIGSLFGKPNKITLSAAVRVKRALPNTNVHYSTDDDSSFYSGGPKERSYFSNDADWIGAAERYDPSQDREVILRRLSETIRRDPSDTRAFTQRARIFVGYSDWDKAILDYNEAIRLDPYNIDLLKSRSLAWQEVGEVAKAVADFEKIVRLDPNDATFRNNLAWCLATNSEVGRRNGRRAVELATKACELTEWSNAAYLDTLAAACAETGNFDSAVKWQAVALSLSPEDEELRAHLELFKSGKPYHEPALPPEPHEAKQ